MDNQQYLAEDEIDLRSYVNVLIKRKNLILAIFLTAVIATAAVSLMLPKVYEITSVIQLGSINELLIKKEEAKTIILKQNSLLSVINQLGIKIDVESLKRKIKIVGIGETNLVEVKITYPGVDTAVKINDAIICPLIAQGQIIYQENTGIFNERLRELDEEIKNIQADISRTQASLTDFSNSIGISQTDISLRIILLQNTLPNYESHLNSLREQKNKLKLALANTKDFKIFDAPIKPKNPVGPKKKKMVLNAGIISLMLGVFLAFFMEFWQKDKEGKAK